MCVSVRMCSLKLLYIYKSKENYMFEWSKVKLP